MAISENSNLADRRRTSNRHSGSARDAVRGVGGSYGTGEPERPPEPAGLRRPRHGQPLAVDRVALRRVDHDVAISIAPARRLEPDLLMPAVHPRDGIGLHREGEVLVDAGVAPPDAGGVGIVGFERHHLALVAYPPHAAPLAPILRERYG